MKGFILTREVKDGTKPDGRPRSAKRYDACWRVNGKQKSKTFGKRKAAERFLTTVVGKVQDGTYREIIPTTFKAFAEQWLAGLGNLKPSTRRAYGSLVHHQLIPTFGERPLASLTVEDVNQWLAARDGELRTKTLQNVLGLLHKLFADALETGYLAVNRLDRSRALRRPRALREEDEIEIEVLTPAEINRVLDALDPADRPVIETAVCTGVRLGELLALQWGDLDEIGKRLHVRRSVYRGEFYLPKSRRSKRAIDLGDQLLGVLGGLRRDRYGEVEKTPPPPDALLFPAEDGKPRDPDQLRKRVWAPALAKAGVRHVRLHSLRHTFASMLIHQNESPKYISSQLGHASIQITFDRYGHLFPNEKRTAASRLEAQLFGAVPSSSHPAEPAGTPEITRNTVEDGSALTPRQD
jgi:integrase